MSNTLPVVAVSRRSRSDRGVKRDVASKLFFLTFKNQWEESYCRQHVLEYFVDVVTYCIALEECKSISDENLVYKHLHCFLEFKSGWTLSELNLFVRENITSEFDLQKCKSKRNILKYISKEDTNLYFNCKIDDLNFNYLCYNWAKENPYFSFTHPFVVKHRFCWNFIKKYHVQFHSSLLPWEGFRPFSSRYNNWADAVIDWYNGFISSSGTRRKQLFLWGPTCVGKTTLIESLFIQMDYCYYPDVGKFFMTGFDSGLHKFIVFEEFDIQYHVVNFLKRLLEGRNFGYCVKGSDPKFLNYQGPVVFVSNDLPSFCPALESRLEVIHADTPYF